VRRYSEGREDRHAGFVAEFIQMKVDLMVTSSSIAVRTAKDATNTIPIVMLGVGRPERQGLVASLARLGGNVTECQPAPPRGFGEDASVGHGIVFSVTHRFRKTTRSFRSSTTPSWTSSTSTYLPHSFMT
jgi:ABC transporter substrate binding protein